MKKAYIFPFLFLFLTSSSFSQKISNIDFDQIELKVKDSTSSFYYPHLIERFKNSDTTLTNKEFQCIYYGSVFQSNYNPYGMDVEEEKFMEAYKKQKYKKAISIGVRILEKNPLNLTITFKTLVCYNLLEDSLKADFYARRYFPLLAEIFRSGDGESYATSYVIVNIMDEYEILDDLELISTGQSLIGETDVLDINLESQKSNPKIEKLYFNVTKPLDYLNSMFK